jgi:hypothetical protein
MKKLIINVLAWAGIFLFCVGIALAQEARIVHYDADAKADSKRPDFKGALIAIDFGGTSAVSVKDLFMRLGARDFVEGKNPCVFAHTLICVRVSVGGAMQVSSSGQSGGYGGNGYQSGGSFSGSLYPVNLDVFLVKYDEKNGGERPTLPLGHAQCLASAGSGTSYSSSYGSRGGGTYYTSSTNDLDADMGNAVRQDMNALLSRNALNKFLAWGTYSKWFPGADNAVKDAFGR